MRHYLALLYSSGYTGDLITAIFPCLVVLLKLSSMLSDYPIKCKKGNVWQLRKALRIGEKQCGYS